VLSMSASGTVACGPRQDGINDALGLGPDTINFPFRFSAESPPLLSVAHTVSAECVMSLSAYFQFRPKVKLPLSVDLKSIRL